MSIAAEPLLGPLQPPRRGSLRSYVLTLVIVAVAYALQRLLWDQLAPLTFFLFYPALVLTAVFGDGLVGLILCAVAAQQFANPDLVYDFIWPSDAIRQGAFLGFGSLVLYLSGRRTAALNQLQVERDKLRAVFNHVDVGIGFTDPRGLTEALNPAAIAIHSFQPDERPYAALAHYRENFELQWLDGTPIPFDQWPTSRAQRGEYVRDLELRLFRKPAGPAKVVRYSVIPIRRASGEVTTIVFSMTDLTPIRENEEALKAAVRIRDDFLTIASHELKTPLTSLKLQAQLCLSAIDKGGPEPDLKRIRALQESDLRQIDRLTRLVNDMLDISALNSGRFGIHPEPTELCELVGELVEQYRPQFERAGCTIEVTRCEPVHGLWDRVRIEQVLANLLTNALKYGKGKPVQVQVTLRDRIARVEIRDQGIGIPREHQDRIFDRFERAISANEVSGFGLGLYIAREIVTRHGGTIRVESDAGKGATFIVELPLDPPAH